MNDPLNSIRAASCADDYDPNSMPVPRRANSSRVS